MCIRKFIDYREIVPEFKYGTFDRNLIQFIFLGNFPFYFLINDIVSISVLQTQNLKKLG